MSKCGQGIENYIRKNQQTVISHKPAGSAYYVSYSLCIYVAR